MGENPQHNQHIIEQANVMDAAFTEHNQQTAVLFQDFNQRLDKLESDMEKLKLMVESLMKNNSSAPIPVDVVPTQTSLRKMRSTV